jgi:hypothetical protein
MIRQRNSTDFEAIHLIINDADAAYKGVILGLLESACEDTTAADSCRSARA